MEVQDIPLALARTIEKGQEEYESLIRQTHWRDTPVYMVGSGVSLPVALMGGNAFEDLLGWPVVSRPASVFRMYSLQLLGPRSVLFAISESDGPDETTETAKAARAHGSSVLALLQSPGSLLAQVASGIFVARGCQESGPPIRNVICQQAALCHIALLAASIFTRPLPKLAALTDELQKLPQYADRVLAQMKDAVRSLVREISEVQRVFLIGDGFYHPAVLQWYLHLRKSGYVGVQPFTIGEFNSNSFAKFPEGSTVIFLSGSHCRLKKEISKAAGRARKHGARVLSITDANDHDLVRRATLSLLLPELSEIMGSTLTLVLLAAVLSEASRQSRSVLRQPQE